MTSDNQSSRGMELRAAALQYVGEQSSRRRTWRIVAPIALTSLLLGAGVTYAAATVGAAEGDSQLASDHPSVEELNLRGVRDAFLRDLEAVAGSEDSSILLIDGEPNGFASVIIDQLTPSVSLYWKGPLPRSVQRIIAAHPDIDVHVDRAAYSLLEIARAQEALIERLNDALGDSGSVVLVGSESHGAGLKLWVRAQDLSEERLRHIVKEITSVPIVELELGPDVGTVLY